MVRGHPATLLLLSLLALLAGAANTPRRPLRAMAAGCPGIRLNELLPQPQRVDWNGDGTLNGDDSYVELYNGADTPCDLSGWQLDDQANAGSAPYTFPAGTVLGAYHLRVLFRGTTHITFEPYGDSVRLVQPDLRLVDQYSYFSSSPDTSFSVSVDGRTWVRSYPPSPGRPNLPATSTPNPSPAPDPSPQPSPTGTRSATRTPAPRADPTVTVTPTPTFSPTPCPAYIGYLPMIQALIPADPAGG